MERPGRRELNKIQCRKKILKVSRRLFTSKGYDNTTIEDLADGAEISKATLYNYFPSKANLLVGIADAALEEIRQLIRTELRQEPSPLKKLRRVLETLALDSVRYLPLTRKILYLNSFGENELRITREELMEILSQLVEEAQTAGELRQDLPVSELTNGFLGVYLLTQFGWEELSTYSEETCIAQVNRVIDQALAGLGAGKEER